MAKGNPNTENLTLHSEGLALEVFVAIPADGPGPFPSVQIHHAGGGYESVYEDMALDLASRGFAGITMIHRGYPGSGGQMEYGKGEIKDIGNLTAMMAARPFIDPARMGIMGYSRGAHNSILAIQRFDFFRAGALWSTPVDMLDHVQVNPWIAGMFGGHPETVPQEYHIRSSIHFVDQIDCPILLIHGEQDVVVPVRHTKSLAKAMEQRNLAFELKLFENEGHIWSPSAFYHNWQLSVDFFERHLKARP